MVAAQVPILVYHSVTDAHADAYAPYAIAPKLFADHMRAIADSGREPLCLGRLVERLEQGADVASAVVITFDDGLADFAESAYPILDRFGLPSTLFVTTGYVGDSARWLAPLGEADRPMLRWDELRGLHAAGVELGSHSHTHPHLDVLLDDTLRWELATSGGLLRVETGAAADLLAYPHGSHDRTVIEAAQAAGYRAAAAVKNATCPTAAHLFSLARIVVPSQAGPRRLLELMDGVGIAQAPTRERLATKAFRQVRKIRHGRGHAVGVTSPAPRAAWNQLCGEDRDSLVTQTPGWCDAMAEAGFEDASRLYELADGRRFVLPLVRKAGRPTSVAPEWGYPPGWGIGGLVGPGLDESAISTIWNDLSGAGPVRTVIRPNPVRGAMWAAAPLGSVHISRRAHAVDLSGGAEQAWTNLRKSARRAVRQAEKAGVEIELDTSGRLIPEFYGLLELSFARWGDQQNEPGWLSSWRYHRQDPIEKFHALSAHLGEGFQIWLARVDGQPAATILVLQGVNAHYTRGAMDKALAGPSRANFLLHWHAMQAAIERGSRWYQMGESGNNPGLAHFKERFGAKPFDYAEYRIERFPVTKIEDTAKGVVKRLIGFSDADGNADADAEARPTVDLGSA